MGRAIAVTLAITAVLFYRSATRVLYAFASVRDRRLFVAAPIALAVFVWLVFAAWWSLAHA